MARSCESWLNFTDEIYVVRLPIAFRGFGRSELDNEAASEPYTLTIPCRDLGSSEQDDRAPNSSNTYPMPRYWPVRSPVIVVAPNPPSSFHRLVHLLVPTSQTYTSASSPKLISSVPAPPRAHHMLFTAEFILTLPTTCPVPDRQSTRCTYPLRPATAKTSPVGLKAQISMLPSFI